MMNSIWPCRSGFYKYMLIDFFANFDKTRVIIDTTEIPINKLQNVNAKSATFLAAKTK